MENKFDNELIKYLEEWCDKKSSQFSKLYFKLKDGKIYVYRYDGNGLPGLINKYSSNEQILELKKTEEEYNKLCDEFEKEMIE